MVWLINRIRQCFCNHDWEIIFDGCVECSDGTKYHTKTYRCKKCGYSIRYKSIWQKKRWIKMFDYSKCAREAVEKLDQYDFSDIISRYYKNKDLVNQYDIEEIISLNFPELEDTFECLTYDEIMEYFEKRYTIRFVEEIKYKMVACSGEIRKRE